MFQPYGLSHGIVATVFVVVTVLLLVLPATQTTSRVFALLVVAVQLPFQIHTMLPAQWDVAYSLPLQLCDLALIAAVCALWTHSPAATALTYYWGLTLTAQALLTPAYRGPDFPDWQFLMFWGIHLCTMWAAIYLTWGVGIRPDWHGYRVTLVVTAAWAVIMMMFNGLVDANYGFLNAKPVGSVLDLFGPWPLYLLVAAALITTLWALITTPFLSRHSRAYGPQRGR
ncbi:YwaF family protein [Allokutzneria oryzae]|uniref:TIGR02206 family membrane protein n=1 Tax=Allokutzneria oryzae TaxID=1378989 RepID=A0ABV6A8P5_9PSEU